MEKAKTVEVLKALKSRGFIHQVANEEGLLKTINEGPISCYAGFDPTAESLHIGNLVAVMGLRHFQFAGHRPIVIVGGATGQIGDPSGRTTERQLLTKERLLYNKEKIRTQLSRFLDFSNDRAIMLDNADWLDNFKLIDFLRDVGKYFSVGSMLSKESVRQRMEDRDQGISYTEFSYMLLQAYDFLYLFDSYNCLLQMGGSDQWGNIVEGVELIRRRRSKETYGITFPLLTTADGKKFGKSEQGNIWLDASLTSPYRFYQYWVNADDRDVIRFLYLFTFLPPEEIKALHDATVKAPEQREAQRRLAFELTCLVHGDNVAREAQKASEVLFGKDEGLRELSEGVFVEIFSDVPSIEINTCGASIVDLAVKSGLGKSKSEIRRLIHDGGLYLNNARLSAEGSVKEGDLLHGKYLLLRKGKREYAIIKDV